MSRKIALPRPEHKPLNGDKDKILYFSGTNDSGITIVATTKGLEIGGFYRDFPPGERKYSNLREPIKISWEEFDKIKINHKQMVGGGKIPDILEDDIDESYLKSLPIVTINDSKYYIDGNRRERRPVKFPNQVFRY